MDTEIDLNVENYSKEDLMEIMGVSNNYEKDELLQNAENIILKFNGDSNAQKYKEFIIQITEILLLSEDASDTESEGSEALESLEALDASDESVEFGGDLIEDLIEEPIEEPIEDPEINIIETIANVNDKSLITGNNTSSWNLDKDPTQPIPEKTFQTRLNVDSQYRSFIPTNTICTK